MNEPGGRQGVGRIAGSVAETPFALSRGRAVFRGSQNGRHPHSTISLFWLEGVECSNFLRPALFLSAVCSFVRSFAVRSSFVSAPPLRRRRSFSLFQPSPIGPPATIFPSIFHFHHHTCDSPLPDSSLAQRHRRQLETSLSSFFSFSPHSNLLVSRSTFALSVLPPLSFSVSFFLTTSVFHLFTSVTLFLHPPLVCCFSYSYHLSPSLFRTSTTPSVHSVVAFCLFFLYCQSSSASHVHTGTRCSSEVGHEYCYVERE